MSFPTIFCEVYNFHTSLYLLRQAIFIRKEVFENFRIQKPDGERNQKICTKKIKVLQVAIISVEYQLITPYRCFKRKTYHDNLTPLNKVMPKLIMALLWLIE